MGLGVEGVEWKEVESATDLPAPTPVPQEFYDPHRQQSKLSAFFQNFPTFDVL